MAFSENKIDIGIVRNHLGIHLLAKCIPGHGHFSFDFGKLLGTIESYMISSLLTEW